MGPRGKIGIALGLVTIVVLAVWQFSSPPQLPAVGTKYLQPGLLSSRGAWVILEKSGSGSLFLCFSIANLTYARAGLPTTYSIVISKMNETVNSSFAKSFTVRVTRLIIEDNYEPLTSGFDKMNGLNDAVQVTGLFNFITSANHEVRFTIGYDLYDLLVFGYSIDHSSTRSFNITQNIL